MRQKEVSRRLGSLSEVRASLQTHRDRIARQLEERYVPAAPEAAFRYQSFFDHMDQELSTVETRLVGAEDAHVRKLVRVVEVRRQSQEAAKIVYDKQAAGRAVLAGLYGRDRDYELAGVEGATPRTPQLLAEQVDQTVKLLREPGVEVPEPAVGGVAIEFESVALDLEDCLTPFQEVRAQVARARKAADGTRQVVHDAIEAYDKVFPWVAQNLESLFRLVGERELADRIRTSARRVTRRQGEDQADAEGDPSSDAAATADNEAAGATSDATSSEAVSEASEAAPAA